jgi:hypothetical protein
LGDALGDAAGDALTFSQKNWPDSGLNLPGCKVRLGQSSNEVTPKLLIQ